MDGKFARFLGSLFWWENYTVPSDEVYPIGSTSRIRGANGYVVAKGGRAICSGSCQKVSERGCIAGTFFLVLLGSVIEYLSPVTV